MISRLYNVEPNPENLREVLGWSKMSLECETIQISESTGTNVMFWYKKLVWRMRGGGEAVMARVR